MRSLHHQFRYVLNLLAVLMTFFSFIPSAIAADDTAYAACVATVSARSTACTEAALLPSGSAAAFQSGQNAICDLNYHVIENVNHMLCFLQYQLDFDGAATGTATVSDIDYAWTYSTTDLETFATDQGYSKKIIVTKAAVTQMTMWWDGTGETTKGFMISNKLGISLSNELAIYMQWDKSGEDQWVRYIRGTWDSTVNTGGPMDANGGSINRGKYGYLNYNTTSKEASTLEIVDVKGNDSGLSLDCDKYRIWGNVEGTLGIWAASLISKTSSTLDVTGGSGNVFPVSTGLAGTALADFTTTVDSVTGPGNFSKSCNSVYINRDGGSDDIFGLNADGVRLDFTAVPLTLFGNAAP